jgi:YidC/Oxa1 family membrane protein insertase
MRSHPVVDSEALGSLGSLDPLNAAEMELTFSQAGGGIGRIAFRDIWLTANARQQANHHFEALRDGVASPPPAPPESDRYILQHASTIKWRDRATDRDYSATASVFGAYSISVQGQELVLTSPDAWQSSKPGEFTAHVVDEEDRVVLEISRKWQLGDGFDISLDQTITNMSGGAVEVRWVQYGPPSLIVDRSRYMDRRRFRFGFELSEAIDPDHRFPIDSGSSILLEMGDVTSPDDEPILWPNATSLEEGFRLSWFATTNRYFGLGVHPVLDDQGHGSRLFGSSVAKITRTLMHEHVDGDERWLSYFGSDESEEVILTGLYTSPMTLQSGDSHAIDMGVFAGPLERGMLDDQQPYAALNMGGLILYQMSSFCAICTFQWLALIIIDVLAFLDFYVVFDWGLAIIVLVIIVRTMLHPLTKRSQMNMQQFGKKMQKLKPDMDRIKKKFADDSKAQQQEQMKLMREHGVNPLQMLGCLPMFLQMPIWVALYAVLYFAFDLRQEPAFFGIFQEFWDWPFLADLSAADHFFGEFAEPWQFLMWNMTGINILPILMGGIFFFQQKYMTPQNADTMTPEQRQQQKIMRVMMVVLFPVMLYSAPSGLTLYILTSSSIGIIESRRIRKQVDAMDEAGEFDRKPVKKAKTKDPQARAMKDMIKARKKKKQEPKTFKKRRK